MLKGKYCEDDETKYKVYQTVTEILDHLNIRFYEPFKIKLKISVDLKNEDQIT